jgi:predicted component of type VI protein secretion system
MGPMGIGLYRSLVPGDPVTGDPADGRALVELRELVRFYAGVETDFVLTLVLRADEVPRARLSVRRGRHGAARGRCGYRAWPPARIEYGSADAVLPPPSR